MKTLATVLALSFATTFAAPAFAQTKETKDMPPTQSECEKKPDMRWDQGSKTCIKK